MPTSATSKMSSTYERIMRSGTTFYYCNYSNVNHFSVLLNRRTTKSKNRDKKTCFPRRKICDKENRTFKPQVKVTKRQRKRRQNRSQNQQNGRSTKSSNNLSNVNEEKSARNSSLRKTEYLRQRFQATPFQHCFIDCPKKLNSRLLKQAASSITTVKDSCLSTTRALSLFFGKTRLLVESRVRRTTKELTTMLRFISLALNLLLLSVPCSGEITEEQLAQFAKDRSEAARKWAPLVLFHPNERYFPSDVHSFLRNVVPRNIPADERPPEPPVIVSMSRSLKIAELPEGPEGEDTYLIAPIDPKCKNCPLPQFLRGKKPSPQYSPPVYAIVTSCLPSEISHKIGGYSNASTKKPRKWRRLRTDQNGKRKRRRRFSLRNISKSLKMSGLFPFFRKSVTSAPATNSFSSKSEERANSDENKHRSNRRKDHVSKIDDLQSSSTNSTEMTKPTQSNVTSSSIEENQSKNKSIEDNSPVSFPPPTNTQLETQQIISNQEIKGDNEEVPGQIRLGELKITTETPLPNTTSTTTPTTTSIYIVKEDSTEEFSGSSEARGKSIPSNISNKNELRENYIPEGNIIEQKGHRFTVTYWMFYPFSQGKEVCTSRLWILGRVFKPRLRNKCYGDLVTLNSHVGDWEHVSIYFEDNLPTRMYVSTHTYGAYYHYDANKNLFVYAGKDTRLGIPLNPKYPPIIKMDGTHPVLYSALGSHGLWGSPGVQRYENLVPLEDKTAAGVPWRSWENIDIIDNREEEYNQPHRQWLQFYGRWGNPSYGCHKALFGSCDLASGPTGIPLKRENFPCHIPQHSTFFPKN